MDILSSVILDGRESSNYNVTILFPAPARFGCWRREMQLGAGRPQVYFLGVAAPRFNADFADLCTLFPRQEISTTTRAVPDAAGAIRCSQKEKRCICKVSGHVCIISAPLWRVAYFPVVVCMTQGYETLQGLNSTFYFFIIVCCFVGL